MMARIGNGTFVCLATRVVVAALLLLVADRAARSDTIEGALVQAYQGNPQLNAQRAQVRSTDEAVPQALSGYRPKVSIAASGGYQYTDETLAGTRIHQAAPPSSAALNVTQNLYNGNQTANKTRAAEAQVSGAREALRVLEQGVLFSAASVYMDYLRDSATVEVNKSNVRV